MKQTKRIVCLLLCAAMVLGLSVVAAARWDKIQTIDCTAGLNDDGTSADAFASIETYKNEELTIRLSVSAPGVTTRNYSSHLDCGDYLDFARTVSVEPDNTYTFKFSFIASGETTTRTIYVYS